MIFEISHITEYTYSDLVFFEPHYFRLKPKNTHHLVLKDFTIKIEPEPSGFSNQIDIEDNHNLLCWFDGSHGKMKITSHSLAVVQEYNPFNFLIHPPEYMKFPFNYDEKTNQLVKPSLITEEVSKELIDYLNEIVSETKNQSVDFLVELTKSIHENFILHYRETGNPFNSSYTFEKKMGSCRDLAWMQIQMLRHLGIASRFVSGYFYVDAENADYELHAWVEAFLPGAGWIGLDPGHGMLTNAYHIPLASSAFHELAMPVIGTVRGDASSELKNELKIDVTE